MKRKSKLKNFRKRRASNFARKALYEAVNPFSPAKGGLRWILSPRRALLSAAFGLVLKGVAKGVKNINDRR